MHVTVLWTHAAAQAHGPETTWTGIASVEESMDTIRLHKTDADAEPVVINRDLVVAYNRVDPGVDG